MNRRATGSRFEASAAKFLEEQGCQIIARNYRSGHHEIDLICLKDEVVIFVEVKGSRSEKFGDAVYKVDQRKQQSLIAAAQGFIQQFRRKVAGFRFDVVIVTEAPDGRQRIEHRPNAFTL
ncbi:MAG: YraN family protein [candidate division Zixibacteria bacterium]|nr:YraN family protein [candidate division Zixibacteria bacterium]